MSYELKKPYTDGQRLDFVLTHNLHLEETDMFLFALEPNEIMGEKEIEIDVPDFETVEEEIEVPVYDEEGNPVYDEEGNPVTEKKIIEVEKPVMIEIEEEITVIDYDEEGNPIGEHTEIIKRQVQKTHKETIVVPYPVINPNYEEEQKEKRQKSFLSKFFKVSMNKSLASSGYAYYRKQPKGYTSAIESMNTAERICQKMNGLPAGTLIFYEEPDFADAEQCTEEWLEQHQIALPTLDTEAFDTLYIAFVQAWNTQEHS